MTETRIELPMGEAPKPLSFSHFPTRQQAFVWRNWGLVPLERLASVLGTTARNVTEMAGGMGLPAHPIANGQWSQRGYVTLIRINWHLLGYDQLLELLDWSAERLAHTLKEDDFLWIKLGCLKPDAGPLRYEPLTAEQKRQTVELRRILKKHFPDEAADYLDAPFSFVEQYRSAPGPPSKAQSESSSSLRLVYPYFATYGDPLLERESDLCPDGLLARLSEMGVNGIWLQGVLYSLAPWEAAPELAAGWETRLENLRKLTRRAGEWGIGVYLYLNEPRAMRPSFFEKHPEWKGAEDQAEGLAALCTSQKPILDFLREGTRHVFREAPQLAGVLTITMSENLTNCFSRGGQQQCPRCSRRTAQEVVSEVNTAIERGVHAAKPDARVIVWAWGWAEQWANAAIDMLPETVELMCTSEEALPTRVGGVEGAVADYTISQVGPGPRAREMWAHAQKRGLNTIAKMQINTTWECAALPYLPAPYLVEEHIENVRGCGLTDMMASWTVGGYPGGNLRLLSESAPELAVRAFGREAADCVCRAWRAFSEAMREFPFHLQVVYLGSSNYGPMNLLHAAATGFQASMLGYPYDDLKSWRAIYPEDIFEEQFRKLSTGWEAGLDILKEASALVADAKQSNMRDLQRVALAAYCHFRSTYLQIAFIRLRDAEPSEQRRAEIGSILDEEIEIAKTLHGLAREDCRIGFETSNHYFYTLNDLKEKVLNCEHMRLVLCR